MKRRHGAAVAVKVVLEKPRPRELGRVAVSFTIQTQKVLPACGLAGIGNVKVSRRVKIWAAKVVHDAQVARFDPDHTIHIAGSQVIVTLSISLQSYFHWSSIHL
jgi:hypothetical protein